mmetsp:Transcript_9899/g.11846  ORF Transcript_9899/g.11846 Transcript_9899/m.11846 type:complete len:217 (+) Transcript_9899:208-858(+)
MFTCLYPLDYRRRQGTTYVDNKAMILMDLHLPEEMKKKDWMTVKVNQCYRNLNRLYWTEFHSYFLIQDFGGTVYPNQFCRNDWAKEWGKAEVRVNEISANDYVDFVLGWLLRVMNDKVIVPPFQPVNFVTDIVKPVIKRIFHVYAVLFNLQSKYPVSLSSHTLLEEYFDHFIYVCLYWGLLDFSSDDVKALDVVLQPIRENYERDITELHKPGKEV